MTKITTIYILLALVVSSCGVSKNSNSAQADNSKYMQLVTEKLGEHVNCTMNEDETYQLCISETKGTVQQPRNSMKYIIIKLSDNSVVLESTVDGGTVDWYNQKMIQVYQTPGIMREDQTRDDFITLYNVETGKSFPKNLKETH